MRKPRSAFTLVELLVVIGIVAVLAGILLVVLSRATTSAKTVRAQADLQAISMALESYRQDFGDYPRASGPTDNDGAWLLTWSLVGPADNDGAPGPGFRARAGGQGIVHGPYIDVNSFELRRYDDGTDVRWYLGDKVFRESGRSYSFGQPFADIPAPVLYMPRSVRKTVKPEDAYVGVGAAYMYDPAPFTYWSSASHWPDLTAITPMDQLRGMMGDLNGNGRIDSGETAAFTGPYILWMAGPDGYFGLTNSQGGRDTADGAFSTDDVANFDFDKTIKRK